MTDETHTARCTCYFYFTKSTKHNILLNLNISTTNSHLPCDCCNTTRSHNYKNVQHIAIYILVSLLYKAEKPSVCLSVCPHFVVELISQPWLHGSTSDLLDVIATSSGMTKFIFKSF